MGSGDEKRLMAEKNADGHETGLLLELHTPIEDERPVLVTGNFNDWAIDPGRFQLTRLSPGHFQFRFPREKPPVFPLVYKYVKGGWDDQEVDAFGSIPPNRRLEKPQNLVVDHAPRWKSKGLSYEPGLLPSIQVISERFEIPQLIKTRRIAALLPHDYHSSEKRYPVLYLQDGQNLFDDYAPFGNWAVDKKLAVMAEQGLADIIIISIDHAADERIAEFTPSHQTKLGIGDGKKYARFLADTLKPYVDQHFRTLPDRIHTGIGGSSMGGLITIYAGLMYPEVYGRLMVFSPSLWVDPNIPHHGPSFGGPLASKIYIYAGGKEGMSMIPNVNGYREALERGGKDTQNLEFKISIDPEGEHNEEHWGREFPKAVEWLFFGR